MTIQTDQTRLREGQLVRWDAAKGFGFIRPTGGGNDVFLHISALPQGQVPGIGARIAFSAVDDPQGRGQRALKAIIDGAAGGAVGSTATQPRAPRPTAPAPRPNQGSAGPRPKRRDETLRSLQLNKLTLAVAATTLFCLWGALTALPLTPIPLLAYPIFSLAAFLLYARDKFSAIRGAWRIPESSLHLVEAIGGWPGAYVAQQTMRHKTVKQSYQIVFWLIVSLHVGCWGLWVFAPGPLRQWSLPGTELPWTPHSSYELRWEGKGR